MHTFRTEAATLLRLAVPITVTQVGAMMLGVVDNVMVGQVSVAAFDAAALGNISVTGTLVAALGIVVGMDPLVSQAHGARDGARMGLALQQGLVVALLVSVPVSILWLFTEEVLVAAGQDPGLSRLAHEFVLAQIPGIAPFLLFIAQRQYLQGRGILFPPLAIMLLANGVNVGLNWILIYGNLGAPALGVVGSGLSTTITRFFLAIGLALWIRWAHLHRDAWQGWTREAWRPRRIGEILRYGLPTGFHLALEVWAFQIATLFAGLLGEEPLAASTIALTLASLSFMVPLGISLASVTRVGNLIGAGDSRGAQRAGWVAFALTATAMSLLALLFTTLREILPTAFTSDARVISLAASILPIVALFQLFDGTQVVGSGILRAMGRPRAAAIFNFLGYYLLAIPLAWWLTFEKGVGVTGIWWGLSAGLASVATMFLFWIWHRGPARVHSRIVENGRSATPPG